MFHGTVKLIIRVEGGVIFLNFFKYFCQETSVTAKEHTHILISGDRCLLPFVWRIW